MLELKSLTQYFISILSVVLLSVLCLGVRDVIDYKIVGYVLLVLVSIQAIFFEIKPVLVGAVLSALTLNFLFIKPYYTFHIDSTEDALLLLLFFIIVLINAVLTNKIKRMQKVMHIEEAKAATSKLYNMLFDSLSRELQKPIAKIIASADTLRRKKENISDETNEKLLDKIEEASMQLNYQVENLMSVSKLESGNVQLKFDWCDVKKVIDNVRHRLTGSLHGHKIIVDIEDNLPLFKLDFSLMEKILYHLLYNACQYTPKGTEILVQVRYDVDTDYETHVDLIKKCMVIVSDNGQGFPEEEIDSVFDKFYHIQNPETGGTGLGLSIVKGFVEAQHGTINLTNAEDGGAVFEMAFAVDCKPSY